MVSLEELQTLAQLVDSIEIGVDKIEQSYQNNDAEEFKKSRDAILSFQQKINEILGGY